jgi:hypothetical protein
MDTTLKESAVTKFIRFSLIGILTFTATAPAFAQKNAAPEITVTQNGADNLLDDLKSVVMANPKNQKEWANLKAYLEVFLIEVDQKKPLRLDLVVGDGPLRFRPSIPVKNIRKFRKENLFGIGIKTRQVAASLYRCSGAFEGYMRYSKKTGYATFAEKRAGVPLSAKSPLKGIEDLVKKYDLALRGSNTAINGADLMDRRTWFQKTRTEIEAGVKKKETESQAAFDLRKLLLKHQLNEGERIYAEAAELIVGWNTDVSKGEGQLDLLLSAIDGTSLHNSVKLLGVKPTHFANIARSKTSILSARVNHPLDDLRQTHFLEMFKAIRNQAVASIEADKKFTAEDKKARTTAADLVVKLLSANVSKGMFDGFVEVHENKNGKNTAIGGMRTVDGKVVVDVLNALAKTDKDKRFKLDHAKEGDVRIHSVKINVKDHPSFKLFLGDDTLYIGTSEKTIWFASGVNAVAELKTAIQQTKLPNKGKASDPFVDIYVKVGPWLKLHQERRGNEGDVQLRKDALAAFKPGIDALTLQFRREEDNIIGQMVVQNDILRFAGNMIAKFTKEQLSEDEEEGTKKDEKK